MSSFNGFRVTANLGRECVSDTFELRQAAIECAQVLDRMGLHNITVREVRFSDYGELYVPPLDWCIAPATSRAPARAWEGES